MSFHCDDSLGDLNVCVPWNRKSYPVGFLLDLIRRYKCVEQLLVNSWWCERTPNEETLMLLLAVIVVWVDTTLLHETFGQDAVTISVSLYLWNEAEHLSMDYCCYWWCLGLEQYQASYPEPSIIESCQYQYRYKYTVKHCIYFSTNIRVQH